MKKCPMVLSLFAALCITSMQCKDDGVAPRPGPDTTSHSFMFTQYTFGGQGGSSFFEDVAIVNDGCVYAVGEVYSNDSTGKPDPQPYNLAVWNGIQWRLVRLYYQAYNTNNVLAPIRGIVVFGDRDIWLAAGSVFHWDGISVLVQMSFSRLMLQNSNGTIEKLWRSSSTSICGVGNSGTIIFFSDGWRQLASGTSLDFQDIWGGLDPATGREEILAVASQPFSNYDRAILQISGNTVTALPSDSIQYSLSTVWFVPGSAYYVAGSGVYQKHQLSEPAWSNGVYDVTHYYIYSMRGNAANDIIAVGGTGEVLHYNGTTWKSYYDQTKLAYGNYYAVAIKGNVAVAVGEDSPRAVIAVGRR